MTQTVARIVSNLGFKPIILHEQPNGGKTIIEKFESNAESINFAIILLSADDLAASVRDLNGVKDEDISHHLEKRARHNVVFEIRSVPQPGAHGHQATYRADGALITNTIAAGTADFAAPSPKIYPRRLSRHRENDVLPFIRALQLDGNPCLPDNGLSAATELVPRNLNRPALFEGQNTRRYIEHRPPFPTGITHIP